MNLKHTSMGGLAPTMPDLVKLTIDCGNITDAALTSWSAAGGRRLALAHTASRTVDGTPWVIVERCGRSIPELFAAGEEARFRALEKEVVGEGYVSAEDLDKTIRDGLGLRWAFMGPFETIELNAPGGIPDYCARYGETLLKLSSAPVTPAVWSKANVAKAVESWGRNPSKDDVAGKSRWRDERIAALVAHKKSQPQS